MGDPHDPEIGRAITESGKTRAFTMQGARFIGLPTVTVVYVVEGDLIAIEVARFADPVHERAGHG